MRGTKHSHSAGAAAVAHSLHLWLIVRGSRVRFPVLPHTWSCWLLRCHLTCAIPGKRSWSEPTQDPINVHELIIRWWKGINLIFFFEPFSLPACSSSDRLSRLERDHSVARHLVASEVSVTVLHLNAFPIARDRIRAWMTQIIFWLVWVLFRCRQDTPS